jgi:hypothetical protein
MDERWLKNRQIDVEEEGINNCSEIDECRAG